MIPPFVIGIIVAIFSVPCAILFYKVASRLLGVKSYDPQRVADVEEVINLQADLVKSGQQRLKKCSHSDVLELKRRWGNEIIKAYL